MPGVNHTLVLTGGRCFAWEHFGDGHGDGPGLPGGQGITAVPVLLHWAGWKCSGNWDGRDCDLQRSPQWSRDPPLACGAPCARAGGFLKEEM